MMNKWRVIIAIDRSLTATLSISSRVLWVCVHAANNPREKLKRSDTREKRERKLTTYTRHTRSRFYRKEENYWSAKIERNRFSTVEHIALRRASVMCCVLHYTYIQYTCAHKHSIWWRIWWWCGVLYTRVFGFLSAFSLHTHTNTTCRTATKWLVVADNDIDSVQIASPHSNQQIGRWQGKIHNSV